MRRFRRFRVFASGWIRWTVLLGACAYLLVRLADLMLLAPLTMVAETEALQRGIDAVNRIMLGSVGALDHTELISYEKDQQGRIAAYHVDTQAVNRIAAEAATAVRGEFRKFTTETFAIPMGALSGSQLLATRGPRIPVLLVPIGSVTINVRQEFKAEGINQTRHRLWLHADARVRVILPLVSKEMEVTSDLPITETVIVGPVPASFYTGNLGGVTLPAKP